MAFPRGRKLTPTQRRFATPQAAYRSGLEEQIAEEIRRAGHTVRFEKRVLPFVEPAKSRKYTPDFELDNGIIIESKGLFTTEDRQKMRLIKAAYPDLDIRMVFSNARAKIAKGSKTSYADWAERYGFPWAHKTIPPEWFT